MQMKPTLAQIYGRYCANEHLISKLDTRNGTPCREIRYLRYINQLAYKNELWRFTGAKTNNHDT